MSGDGRRADASHFEARASAARPVTYDWRSGTELIHPALRAPYERVHRSWKRDAGALVLDYGCGHGIHSIPPAAEGCRVVGVDVSPRSLALARERAARACVSDRVRFVVADGTTLPFGDAAFDRALAVDVLPYIAPGAAFAELARVLRRTGTLTVIDTLGHNPLWDLHRRLRAWRGQRTDSEVRHVPRLRDLAVGRRHFADAEIAFFGLLAPLIAPFPRRASAALAGRLDAIDQRLLRLRPLGPLAFKVVCTFSRPIRPSDGQE